MCATIQNKVGYSFDNHEGRSMGQIFKPKQTVYTESSNPPCIIETDIGSGGQREVYRARIDDRPIAVKWWWPHIATSAQRKALCFVGG